MKGSEEVFYGSLLLVCADNLAAQFVGGFKTLSAALRKCRYCLGTDLELQTQVHIHVCSANFSHLLFRHVMGRVDILFLQFVAESFHPRGREEHKKYVELLAGPAPEYIATTYGVVFDSILNR